MTSPRSSPIPCLPAEAVDKAASVLRVLAHADRLRIVEALEPGPLTVSQLIHRLTMPQSNASQHLNFMKAHGILDSERSGRNVSYRIVHPHALTILACIRRQCGEQDPQTQPRVSDATQPRGRQ